MTFYFKRIFAFGFLIVSFFQIINGMEKPSQSVDLNKIAELTKDLEAKIKERKQQQEIREEIIKNMKTLEAEIKKLKHQNKETTEKEKILRTLQAKLEAQEERIRYMRNFPANPLQEKVIRNIRNLEANQSKEQAEMLHGLPVQQEPLHLPEPAHIRNFEFSNQSNQMAAAWIWRDKQCWTSITLPPERDSGKITLAKEGGIHYIYTSKGFYVLIKHFQTLRLVKEVATAPGRSESRTIREMPWNEAKDIVVIVSPDGSVDFVKRNP